MRIVRTLAGTAMLAILITVSSGVVSSQDKKDPPKVKGQIPTGWGKLGLDAAQKQSIYSIQAEYKDKITKLEEEIKKLEAERYKKMLGVLKPEQRKMLTEGLDPEPKKSKDN